MLSIVDRPDGDLRLDPNNPRVHNRNQIQQIAWSIKTFGFNLPVLIDAREQLVSGHGRVLAAQRLGMIHVPTIRLEHLTAAQVRAFMIAENRLTEDNRRSIWI
jgi:ParB-like chromosome segregation protein Spo0J